MTVLFVPVETRAGERRVAATPDSVRRLVKLGLEVVVESGAGRSAGFEDAAYRDAGATLGGPGDLARAQVVLRVQPPTAAQAEAQAEGTTLIGFLAAQAELDAVAVLQRRRITAVAMELVPRITRAQSMDALSSQATVAGYKAVVLAAQHSPRLFPLLMTAAGTVRPAKCVVFGAGVAGLQAIATARRLGCQVEATDVRLAAKEQVESLGAKFIQVEGAADQEGAGGYAKEASEEFLKRQREEVARRVAEANVVITTAQVPGRKAPLLITEDMLRAMAPGSVVVDLAVESGGNCALVELDQVVERHGVTLVGIGNLPATVPYHASELYARNLVNLVAHAVPKGGGAPHFDPSDEIFAAALLTHAGEVRHGPTAAALAQREAADGSSTQAQSNP